MAEITEPGNWYAATDLEAVPWLEEMDVYFGASSPSGDNYGSIIRAEFLGRFELKKRNKWKAIFHWTSAFEGKTELLCSYTKPFFAATPTIALHFKSDRIIAELYVPNKMLYNGVRVAFAITDAHSQHYVLDSKLESVFRGESWAYSVLAWLDSAGSRFIIPRPTITGGSPFIGTNKEVAKRTRWLNKQTAADFEGLVTEYYTTDESTTIDSLVDLRISREEAEAAAIKEAKKTAEVKAAESSQMAAQVELYKATKPEELRKLIAKNSDQIESRVSLFLNMLTQFPETFKQIVSDVSMDLARSLSADPEIESTTEINALQTAEITLYHGTISVISEYQTAWFNLMTYVGAHGEVPKIGLTQVAINVTQTVVSEAIKPVLDLSAFYESLDAEYLAKAPITYYSVLSNPVYDDVDPTVKGIMKKCNAQMTKWNAEFKKFIEPFKSVTTSDDFLKKSFEAVSIFLEKVDEFRSSLHRAAEVSVTEKPIAQNLYVFKQKNPYFGYLTTKDETAVLVADISNRTQKLGKLDPFIAQKDSAMQTVIKQSLADIKASMSGFRYWALDLGNITAVFSQLRDVLPQFLRDEIPSRIPAISPIPGVPVLNQTEYEAMLRLFERRELKEWNHAFTMPFEIFPLQTDVPILGDFVTIWRALQKTAISLKDKLVKAHEAYMAWLYLPFDATDTLSACYKRFTPPDAKSGDKPINKFIRWREYLVFLNKVSEKLVAVYNMPDHQRNVIHLAAESVLGWNDHQVTTFLQLNGRGFQFAYPSDQANIIVRRIPDDAILRCYRKVAEGVYRRHVLDSLEKHIATVANTAVNKFNTAQAIHHGPVSCPDIGVIGRNTPPLWQFRGTAVSRYISLLDKLYKVYRDRLFDDIGSMLQGFYAEIMVFSDNSEDFQFRLHADLPFDYPLHLAVTCAALRAVIAAEISLETLLSVKAKTELSMPKNYACKLTFENFAQLYALVGSLSNIYESTKGSAPYIGKERRRTEKFWVGEVLKLNSERLEGSWVEQFLRSHPPAMSRSEALNQLISTDFFTTDTLFGVDIITAVTSDLFWAADYRRALVRSLEGEQDKLRTREVYNYPLIVKTPGKGKPAGEADKIRPTWCVSPKPPLLDWSLLTQSLGAGLDTATPGDVGKSARVYEDYVPPDTGSIPNLPPPFPPGPAPPYFKTPKPSCPRPEKLTIATPEKKKPPSLTTSPETPITPIITTDKDRPKISFWDKITPSTDLGDGVEGPRVITSVQGSTHQADEVYGNISGTQCMSMAYTALVFHYDIALDKGLGVAKDLTKDLVHCILRAGNRIHEDRCGKGKGKFLALDELPLGMDSYNGEYIYTGVPFEIVPLSIDTAPSMIGKYLNFHLSKESLTPNFIYFIFGVGTSAFAAILNVAEKSVTVFDSHSNDARWNRSSAGFAGFYFFNSVATFVEAVKSRGFSKPIHKHLHGAVIGWFKPSEHEKGVPTQTRIAFDFYESLTKKDKRKVTIADRKKRPVEVKRPVFRKPRFIPSTAPGYYPRKPAFKKIAVYKPGAPSPLRRPTPRGEPSRSSNKLKRPPKSEQKPPSPEPILKSPPKKKTGEYSPPHEQVRPEDILYSTVEQRISAKNAIRHREFYEKLRCFREYNGHEWPF